MVGTADQRRSSRLQYAPITVRYRERLLIHVSIVVCVVVGRWVAGTSMVSQVSKALADSSISTYYLSTFTSDFALVPRDRVKDAVRVLRENYGADVDESDLVPSSHDELVE